MEEAERPADVDHPACRWALIFILLYLAFRSFLDAIVVFATSSPLAMGGIWALYLTGTNFSISAAVGFVSLFGVAIMDGLLLISYFNALRAQGLPLARGHHAGRAQAGAAGDDDRADRHPRPACRRPSRPRSARQTQRPLAIVVVGGMITTLFLDALPDAGALQLLRPPRAARGQRWNGPLSLEFSARAATPPAGDLTW